MRDRLVALINEAKDEYPTIPSVNCCKPTFAYYLADRLLANGGILPLCKVGDTVYVCNRTAGKVFKNTVVGIFLSGASPHRNGIKCEYGNICGETSNRKFTFAQIGKTIFLTREEAEQALKEKE